MSEETHAVDVKDEGADVTSSRSYSKEIETLSAMSEETHAADVKGEKADASSCRSYSQEVENLSAMSEETLCFDVNDEGADMSSTLSYSEETESLSDAIGKGEEGEGIGLQLPRYSLNGVGDEYEHVKVESSSWCKRMKHLLSGVNFDNIALDVPKIATIVHCPKCNCYLRPPGTWIKAQVASKEFMWVCVRSLKILSKLKLISAKFVGTDPCMNGFNVKLTLQKEVVTGVILERDYTVEFVIRDDMCESCSS